MSGLDRGLRALLLVLFFAGTARADDDTGTSSSPPPPPPPTSTTSTSPPPPIPPIPPVPPVPPAPTTTPEGTATAPAVGTPEAEVAPVTDPSATTPVPPEAEATTATTATATTTDPLKALCARVQSLGNSHYAIPRELIDYYVAHPQLAGKLARTRWAQNKSGQIVGVRLKKIPPASPLLLAGLLPGDLVQTVNGKPVTSFGQGLSAVTELKKKDKVEIKIKRRTVGAMTLVYEIS
jgi:membrane-associated protease RseP (regulator of RpoE activity)